MYTVYDRIFGDFPAKNAVYTPYLYGYGQPYIYYRYMFKVRGRMFMSFLSSLS